MKIYLTFFKKHTNIHTVMVVAGVVMVWRGLWGIMDLFLFPDFPLLSYWVSLMGGIVLLLLVENFTLKDLE